MLAHRSHETKCNTGATTDVIEVRIEQAQVQLFTISQMLWKVTQSTITERHQKTPQVGRSRESETGILENSMVDESPR